MLVSTHSSYLGSLGNILGLALNVYIWIILIRVLLSWLSPNPNTPFMRFLYNITEPALKKARKICPLSLGGLDFSPMLLIIALNLIASVTRMGLGLIGEGFSPMVLLPVLIQSLVFLLSSLTFILIIIMLARLVISLAGPNPYNPLVMVIYSLTEPLLAPLRRWFPKGPYGLDLKALVFVLGLVLFNSVVLGSLIKASQIWTYDFAPRQSIYQSEGNPDFRNKRLDSFVVPEQDESDSGSGIQPPKQNI